MECCTAPKLIKLAALQWLHREVHYKLKRHNHVGGVRDLPLGDTRFNADLPFFEVSA